MLYFHCHFTDPDLLMCWFQTKSIYFFPPRWIPLVIFLSCYYKSTYITYGVASFSRRNNLQTIHQIMLRLYSQKTDGNRTPTYRVKTTPMSWCTSTTCHSSSAFISWSKQMHSKTKSLVLSKSPIFGFWQHSTVVCTCYRTWSCCTPSPASIIKPSAQTAWLPLCIASAILRLCDNHFLTMEFVLWLWWSILGSILVDPLSITLEMMVSHP